MPKSFEITRTITDWYVTVHYNLEEFNQTVQFVQQACDITGEELKVIPGVYAKSTHSIHVYTTGETYSWTQTMYLDGDNARDIKLSEPEAPIALECQYNTKIFSGYNAPWCTRSTGGTYYATDLDCALSLALERWIDSGDYIDQTLS